MRLENIHIKYTCTHIHMPYALFQVHIALRTAKQLSAWASQEQRPCYKLLPPYFFPYTCAIVTSSLPAVLPLSWTFSLCASALPWTATKQKGRKIKRRVINNKMITPAPQKYPLQSESLSSSVQQKISMSGINRNGQNWEKTKQIS